MSDYRESSNQAKDVRRGVVDIRPVGGKRRQGKRTVVVEVRYPTLRGFPWAQNWHTYRRYADIETAQSTIDWKSRTHPNREYRLKPQA